MPAMPTNQPAAISDDEIFRRARDHAAKIFDFETRKAFGRASRRGQRAFDREFTRLHAEQRYATAEMEVAERFAKEVTPPIRALYEFAGIQVRPWRSPSNPGDFLGELWHQFNCGLIPPPSDRDRAEISEWLTVTRPALYPDDPEARPVELAGLDLNDPEEFRKAEQCRILELSGVIESGERWAHAATYLAKDGWPWGLACHPLSPPNPACRIEIEWLARRAGLRLAVEMVPLGGENGYRPRVLMALPGPGDAIFRRLTLPGIPLAE